MKRGPEGVVIETVEKGGAADRAGILSGDRLISVNGNPVEDIIDYMFHSSDLPMSMKLGRGQKTFEVELPLEPGEDPGLGLGHFKVSICKNKCLFCFVSQLPKGLRRTLYVKDEDYRMSFLYGNYITLTNLSSAEKKRIVAQRLSPLYISVHATDRGVRNRLLGNPKAADVMKELKYFASHRLRMHVQIVLCPGINDGQVLKKTIRDLYSLYPYISSIAVVPVGLTSHRRQKVEPVGGEEAVKALGVIDAFQKRFRKKHGEAIVYAADELYIKAGTPFPPLDDYGDMPQIENGVGMVPLFLAQRRRRYDIPATKKKYMTFTGMSFFPFLKKFIDRLSKAGVDITLVPVENRLFGPSVTVAGLLTGRDVVSALCEAVDGRDVLLIPDCVIREEGDMFLDDVSPADVGAALGLEVRVIEATPEGLVEGLSEVEKGG